jgi:23S rRNA maturation mini-RNase III
MLFDGTVENRSREWELGYSMDNVNPNFEYPYVLQAAMNSVVSSLNRQALAPRFTAETDVNLLENIEKFTDATKPYLDFLNSLTIPIIKSLVRRFVSYDAVGYTITATKQILIDKVDTWASSFVSVLLRSVSAETKSLLVRHLAKQIATQNEADAVVKTIVNGNLTKDIKQIDVASFRRGCPLTENAVLGVIDMFRARDTRIREAYADVHSGGKNYQPFQQSLFLAPEFLCSLQSGANNDTLLKFFPATNQYPFANYRKIFCINKNENNVYSVLVLDLASKQLLLVDSSLSSIGQITEPSRVFLLETLAKFRELSESLNYNFDTWSVDLYPYQYYPPIQHDDHSAFLGPNPAHLARRDRSRCGLE